MIESKTLKIYGIFFIVLAIFDAIMLGVNWFSGEYNELLSANIEGISQDVIQGVLIALVVVMIIEILVKLFLGIRGIQQSNGTCKGKSHITIAKILFVLAVLGLIVTIPEMSMEASKIVSLTADIATIYILWDYIRNSKKLMNS